METATPAGCAWNSGRDARCWRGGRQDHRGDGPGRRLREGRGPLGHSDRPHRSSSALLLDQDDHAQLH